MDNTINLYDDTTYPDGYPCGHMWYVEPNTDLLVMYRLSGLCLRCGDDSRVAVRKIKTNFCMPCWELWWEECDISEDRVHYNEYKQKYWTVLSPQTPEV